MKKIILHRCLIILLLLLTGISSPIEAQSDSRNLTDQLGRKIRLTEDPKRVISLAPNSTEIIFEVAPEKMWSTVLRRLGGEYAWIANYPTDPRLN